MEDNIFDKVHEVDLEKTMKDSYIDYAMSVIASRALPDVRDGLKPVQRRVLYSMIELNNGPDKPHRKCARIVGDTMGKYHPHGDSSIYGALVNMAQEWSTRYPLVDGHGNFGSVDGDGAAAMRYTEARLSKISMEMLADINKDTVDFQPNFDETEREPVVLPSRYPNLLVNGTSGIAVGMATNIPPHNLREVVDAVVKIIDNIIEEQRETTMEEILDIVKGPDFPTGATILGRRGIEEAYRTGRGKIRVRAVTNIETLPNGKSRIIVTELPYLVNKARLISKIAELVRDKKIDGITDLNDHSSRERFELTDVQAQAIVDMRLRALTGLEREKLEAEYADLMEKIRKYEAILADRSLLLRVIREEILAIAEKYGDDRKTSIGYDVYDISTEDLIPRENTVITMTKLGYIKRMTVDNFRSQNRGGRGIKGMQTLEDDYIEELLMTTTHHYLMFFTNTGRVYRLKAYEIPEAGRTARGTAIINLLQLMPGECITAVIPLRKFEDGHYLMMATKNGLVKKTPIKEYANVRKNGLAAITLRDDDELIEVKLTDDKKDIILVTKDGMCIRFKETDVRSTGRTSMGVRGMNIDDGDEVVAMQLNSQGDCLLIVSANGMGKRTSMVEFTCQNRGGKGVKCYKITEKTGDVIGARAVNEDNEVMLITTEGIIIRIACADISILGRITSGVKLINLTEGVTVASVAKVRDKEEKDTNAQQAAVEITDSAETEESDQPTDQETQDENRGEEE